MAVIKFFGKIYLGLFCLQLVTLAMQASSADDFRAKSNIANPHSRYSECLFDTGNKDRCSKYLYKNY